MNIEKGPKSIPHPYTEISKPDEQGIFEIDTAGKKEPKVLSAESRIVKEQGALKKLHSKDPEKYKKVWDKARENAGIRMEQEGKELSVQNYGKKFDQIQHEEAEKLAQQE